MIRTVAATVIIAEVLTLASVTLGSDYCCGGLGFGFPAPILHPGHGDEWWAYGYGDDLRVFDVCAVLFNLVFFTVVLLCPAMWVRMRRGWVVSDVVAKLVTAGSILSLVLVFAVLLMIFGYDGLRFHGCSVY